MAERTSPFTAGTVRGRGVEIAPCPRGSLWQVACWPETFHEVGKALAMACGCPEPAPGHFSAATGGRRLIRVEPLKWWVAGPNGADCPLELTPDQGAVLDMGHDQAAISVTGPAARDVLARMVSIDLRERAFPTGSFATTHMHHMITRVLRDDPDGSLGYEIWVMRSYAGDLAELAASHARRLG